MSTLDKYQKVTKESSKSAENEILVSNKGDPMRHITYGTALLKDGGKTCLTVKASGAAMARAVKVALYLRKRVPGIALLTKITNREVVDEYEPLEEGLDKVVVTRKMVVLEITCSSETLDTKDIGYKGPITEEEIESEKVYLETRRKESTGSQNNQRKDSKGGNPKRERRGGRGGNQSKGKSTDNNEEQKKEPTTSNNRHYKGEKNEDGKPRGGQNKRRGGRPQGKPYAKPEAKPEAKAE